MERHDRCEQRPATYPSTKNGTNAGRNQFDRRRNHVYIFRVKRGPELGKCSSGRDAFDFNLEARMAAGISGTRAVLESVRLASSVAENITSYL